MYYVIVIIFLHARIFVIAKYISVANTLLTAWWKRRSVALFL